MARTLDIARSHINERRGRTPTSRGPYRKAQDVEFLPSIRAIVDARPTYGYRRVTALLNRERRAKCLPAVNAKRGLRIMQHHGLRWNAYVAPPLSDSRGSSSRFARMFDGALTILIPSRNREVVSRIGAGFLRQRDH
uniref:IS3 family transposase n=1 Tax=Pantanalinema rosaneae TaxID=1620701 RepID=UPI003D6F6395